LAAPVRQVRSTVASDRGRAVAGVRRKLRAILLQVRREKLRGQPALREHDQLEIAPEELGRDAPRFAEIRAADAELMIDDRRIDEHEAFFAARRTALVDELEGLLRETLRKIARVGDRR